MLPKRRILGQHFLVQKTTIEKIIDRVEMAANDGSKKDCFNLVEIGPGNGALTKPLIERGLSRRLGSIHDFLIIEKDGALARKGMASWVTMNGSVSDSFSVRVKNADFLDLDPADWLPQDPKTGVGIVSNLPYSVGSEILARLVPHADRIRFMVLMFQAEVAHRVRANPGDRDVGSLTLFARNQWDAEKIESVSPGAFKPPPKVRSEVLLLTPRAEAHIPAATRGEGAAAWEKLIRRCFSQRRKMLRAVLGSSLAPGIDGTKRAEALQWPEWKMLFESWFGTAKALLAVLGFALFCASPASANVSDTFGLGSSTSALGGISAVDSGSEGLNPLLNPAALARKDGPKLSVSFGTVFMHASFLPIDDVVIENAYTSDETTPRFGSVDTSYRDTFGQMVGLGVQTPGFWNLSIGFTAYTPLDQIGTIDSGEAYIPEYFLYRSRTQRSQFSVGAGVRPSIEALDDALSFGVGFSLGYSISSKVTAFLATDDSKSSNFRLASTLKPQIIPYIGFLYDPGPSKSWSAGLRVGFASAAQNDVTVDTSLEALSGFAAPNYFFTSQSALYYDPFTVQLAFKLTHSPLATTYAQVDYQAWSHFESPSLFPQGDPSVGVDITDGKPPAFDFRDIFVPRVGEELTVGSKRFRAGYAYQPSILASLPTGAGNFLDPPQHIITAGMGLRFNGFLGIKADCSLDFHLSLHQLVRQEITKTPGDENGTGTGDIKIGAPGYAAGGRIYGGGLSMTLNL